MAGRTSSRARGPAQRTPVPRGPYSHLWQPDCEGVAAQAAHGVGLGCQAVNPVDA